MVALIFVHWSKSLYWWLISGFLSVCAADEVVKASEIGWVCAETPVVVSV